MSVSRQQLDADRDRFEALALDYGISVSPGLLKQLVAYRDLMVGWNDRVRLVSRADTVRVLSRHVFESLLILPYLPSGSIRLGDIGSGGGLPGVPLCLAADRIQATLIDSARMKTLFLKEVARSVEPARLEVLHQRAEQVAESRSGTFDITTSRAVASLDRVWELAEPLLKPQGSLIALKGPGEAQQDLGPVGIHFEEHVIDLSDRAIAIVIVRKH